MARQASFFHFLPPAAMPSSSQQLLEELQGLKRRVSTVESLLARMHKDHAQALLDVYDAVQSLGRGANVPCAPAEPKYAYQTSSCAAYD